MKFKTGDKVKLVTYRYGDDIYNPVWNGTQGKTIGVISRPILSIIVKWPHGSNSYGRETDLQLIQTERKHHPLTKIFR